MEALIREARRRLLERRRSLDRLSREHEVGSLVAGAAQPSAAEGVAAQLSDRDQRELAEIDAAVERMDAGGYGRCESCGRAIGRQRLLALPEARLCLTCSSVAGAMG